MRSGSAASSARSHAPAPADAPINAFLRGRPVRELRQRVADSLERLGDSIDAVAVATRFDRLADVDDWQGVPVWLHGDLHSANLLARDGAICAVIDFGDVTSGDPAVDLAIGWMLFDDDALGVFRASAGTVDDATWSRAQAWALHFALLYLLHSADNPRVRADGCAAARACRSDVTPGPPSSRV